MGSAETAVRLDDYNGSSIWLVRLICIGYIYAPGLYLHQNHIWRRRLACVIYIYTYCGVPASTTYIRVAECLRQIHIYVPGKTCYMTRHVCAGKYFRIFLEYPCTSSESAIQWDWS